MKRLLMKCAMVMIAAAVFAGCATVEEPKSPEPVLPALTADPNPFADYNRAMASDAKYPMAVEWHNQNAARLDSELSLEALKALMPKTAAEADTILAGVKPAYESDPMLLTKISALSQLAMCRKWDKAPAAREIWTWALIRAAEKAPDAYRAMFYLDQLRWCGKSAQAERIAAVGSKGTDVHVQEFAALVAREVKEAK